MVVLRIAALLAMTVMFAVAMTVSQVFIYQSNLGTASTHYTVIDTCMHFVHCTLVHSVYISCGCSHQSCLYNFVLINYCYLLSFV